MKRLAVPAILVAVVLVLALAGTASAAQDHWRIGLSADDGANYAVANRTQAGVYPGASDGYNSNGNDDGGPSMTLWADFPGISTHVAASVPGRSDLYQKNIQSPTLPAPMKTWDFYVAANVNSASSVIRPMLFTIGTSYLPPAAFNGITLKYSLILLDNKGVAGAPTSGTVWQLPIPTVSDSLLPYWTCPVNLPVIKLSAKTNEALAAEGYRLQFVQEVAPESAGIAQGAVPEPAGILALAGGLLSLAGYAVRRKRS